VLLAAFTAQQGGYLPDHLRAVLLLAHPEARGAAPHLAVEANAIFGAVDTTP
jgi:hypothetical protein